MMGKMDSVLSKNVVQIFVFIAILSMVDSFKLPELGELSKIQENPRYRFHYYVQDDKNGGNKSDEEYKNRERIQGTYNEASSKGNVNFVNYRTDKSNEDQTEVNNQAGASPFHISLNHPTYNTHDDVSKESTMFSGASPIVVEPINTNNTQEQTFSEPIEIDSKDEYHQLETANITGKLTEQMSTNITEDRNDDVKDEQVTDQILIQENGMTSKQTEFTIPFKKPNTVNADDHRNNDDESIKKDIIKVIQNIKGDNEQTDSQFNLRSTLSDKPIEVISEDFRKFKPQNNNKKANFSFKRQQLPKKPLRVYGFNPNDTYQKAHFTEFNENFRTYNHDSSGAYQTSSTTQTGNYERNQKYKVQIPSQPLYYYDPASKAMFPIYTDLIQNSYPFVENKYQPAYPFVEDKPQLTYPFTENKPQPAYPFIENKHQPAYPFTENKPQPAYPFVEDKPQLTYPLIENKPQPAYSLVEFKPQPVYVFTDNKPQLTYPFAEKKPQQNYHFTENKPQQNYHFTENKPQQNYHFTENKPQPAHQIVNNKPKPSQPQADSSKNGFNLMQILKGGSFNKGSEQAEGSQQTAVKDFIKQESKKLEKLKTHETLEKSKPHTLMLYLNPGETTIDLKSLTSSPELLPFGQQPQADCNGKILKPSAVKADKPLQQIPLCSDCIPALGIMGLQSTKSTTVQQKKSITSPQVLPIWNGPNSPKLNYLILPTPITK